ncbi:hypothetical protein HWV62_42323 [Athelia sp. TMB]|nr:hypothetical protein HWV62_42323 [Athelia sp. TMB]
MLRLLLLSICVFYFTTHLVYAAPSNITAPLNSVANSTSTPLGHIALTSPTCRDIDGCRTLLNIISSCLSTIFICVWAAVHPDVRSPKDSWGEQLIERIFELCGTFLAPEGAMAIAVEQFQNAKVLVKLLEQERLAQRKRWAEGTQEGKRGGAGAASKDSLGSQTEKVASKTRDDDEDTLNYDGEEDESAHSGEKETLIHSQTTPGVEAADLLILTTAGNAWKLREGAELLDRPWTIAHAYFVLCDRYYFFDHEDKPLKCLSPNDVLALVRDGKLVAPPLSELKDRSKGDGLSKARSGLSFNALLDASNIFR